MRSRTAACAVAGLLFLACGTAAFAQANGGRHLRADGHVLLAWLHGSTSEDYRAQAEHMPGVTVLSPTWWGLDSADPGAITDGADPEFVAWAGERGMAVWPQLGNHLDADLTDTVLADSARRARLVRTTADAVGRTGADGLVVGFENLHDRTGPALTAFVGELRAALPGRVVAVTVAPVTDTWSRGSWSTAYERRPLGEIADYLLLTALDQHDDATGPGPVAGLDWTRETVERLLASVPEHKVLLGVPLYARTWVNDPATPAEPRLEATLGMDAMARRLAALGAAHEFDPVAGQRRYVHTDAHGRTRQTWQEDAPSLARRASLATAYNLGGVAAWRAGFAGPEAWDALSQALAADPRPAGRASGPPRLNRLVPVPRVADPLPQAAAGDDGRVVGHGGEPVSPPGHAGLVALAAGLLAAVVAGLAAVARAQRSSRMSASSALSSPPTSMVNPDR